MNRTGQYRPPEDGMGEKATPCSLTSCTRIHKKEFCKTMASAGNSASAILGKCPLFLRDDVVLVTSLSQEHASRANPCTLLL